MTVITLQNDQSVLLSFLLRYKIHLHIFIKVKNGNGTLASCRCQGYCVGRKLKLVLYG